MKTKLIPILLILLWPQQIYAQSLFQNYYGSTFTSIFDIGFTSSPDAYYLLHNASQPVSEPSLMKVDLNGNLLWSKTLNYSASSLSSMKICYSNNNIFISGADYNGGYANFLTKLDTSGTVIWTSEMFYGDININSKIIPNSGGYLLTGHRDYIGSQSAYTFDITLTQFDFNGNLLWAKAYGDNNFEFICNAATKSPNGDIMIAGNYGNRITNIYSSMIARIDSNGTLIWMKTLSESSGFYTKLSPNDITVTSDGNFAFVATSINTNSNFDAQVVKFDSLGTILWSTRIYQIPWHEFGKSILTDTPGNLVIAGSYDYNGNYGDFTAKLDNSGTLISATKTSGTTYNSAGIPIPVYAAIGGNFKEIPGFGYASSGVFHNGMNDERQCLLINDYAGNSSCNAIGGLYNCTWQAVNWTATSITLPSFQTNITASQVAFTSTSRNESSSDICPLVYLTENHKQNLITIFPNPFRDELTVRSEKEISNCTITNSIGENIQEQILLSPSNILKISTFDWPNGIYYMQVHLNEEILIQKIVKIK